VKFSNNLAGQNGLVSLSSTRRTSSKKLHESESLFTSDDWRKELDLCDGSKGRRFLGRHVLENRLTSLVNRGTTTPREVGMDDDEALVSFIRHYPSIRLYNYE